MTKRTRNRLIWAAAAAGVILASLVGAGWYLSGRLEPYVREGTVAYLSSRFDGDVAIEKFSVSMPIRDPLKVLLNKGRGAHVKVKAAGILLRQRGARQGFPLLRLKSLAFELDASRLFDSPAVIDLVRLEGMELAVPPKGDRKFATQPGSGKPPNAIIRRILADGAKLVILPRDAAKAPLRFDLFQLAFEGAGAGVPMKYTTTLNNAKPPGVVYCHGTFGPYNTAEPGETPLTGIYTFHEADLSVFKAIAGKLDSTGRFGGKLNEIVVDGRTNVPDFRLAAVNNPMRLATSFHAIVDGTNGNTLLAPVRAWLGKSAFLCKGGVVRYPGESGKTVDLGCAIKDAPLEDFLRLAVKGGRPPMTGRIDLDLKIVVPPGKVPYSEKLRLAGPFHLREGLFTNDKLQQQLDDMSRRARGKPSDLSIAAAPSSFQGRMDLARQLLTLSDLVFVIPGAMVRLNGQYDMKADTVDFHGQLRTEARLSQMMKTLWKRMVLKPVDPFFAKNGAGAQFDIAITGPASSPAFGLEKKR